MLVHSYGRERTCFDFAIYNQLFEEAFLKFLQCGSQDLEVLTRNSGLAQGHKKQLLTVGSCS